MNEQTFKGVVLRSTSLSDNANLLVVLTNTRGKKLITCHGAKKLTGRSMPAVQPFCFSEMTVAERNGRLTVKEATLIESFFELRGDLLDTSLGQYMLELVSESAREEEDETELLRLLLNSLYALSKKLAPCDAIKAAFELRLLQTLGEAPSFDLCPRCGAQIKAEGSRLFSVPDGGVLCAGCAKEPGEQSYPLGAGAYDALRYILTCPLKRLFSFKLPERGLNELGKAAQECVLYFFEHNFETLKFYNRMKNEL